MTFGLRALLLIVAIVLFVIGCFSDTHELDLMTLGLACTAAATSNPAPAASASVIGRLQRRATAQATRRNSNSVSASR